MHCEVQHYDDFYSESVVAISYNHVTLQYNYDQLSLAMIMIKACEAVGTLSSHCILVQLV